LYTEPESCIAFWWPVDNATIENSCLWVVPGSHKTELKTRMKLNSERKLSFEPHGSTLTWPPHEDYIPVEVNAGDVVVIHGRVIHKSSENTSTKSRHAYTIHLVEGDSVWSKENWCQRPTPFPPLY